MDDQTPQKGTTMPRYRATFHTTISLTVDVDADDEDTAQDAAWDRAEEYLQTVIGNRRDVQADASLDGIGVDTIEPVESGTRMTALDRHAENLEEVLTQLRTDPQGAVARRVIDDLRRAHPDGVERNATAIRQMVRANVIVETLTERTWPIPGTGVAVPLSGVPLSGQYILLGDGRRSVRLTTSSDPDALSGIYYVSVETGMARITHPELPMVCIHPGLYKISVTPDSLPTVEDLTVSSVTEVSTGFGAVVPSTGIPIARDRDGGAYLLTGNDNHSVLWMPSAGPSIGLLYVASGTATSITHPEHGDRIIDPGLYEIRETTTSTETRETAMDITYTTRSDYRRDRGGWAEITATVTATCGDVTATATCIERTEASPVSVVTSRAVSDARHLASEMLQGSFDVAPRADDRPRDTEGGPL